MSGLDFSIELLLDNLPGVVYRCRLDRHWTMEFVSQGIRELTGYAAEDLTGNQRLSYAELIHPEDSTRVASTVQRAVDEARSFKLEYRIFDAAGNLKWVWEQGRAVCDEPGRAVALEGFITDITLIKHAEEYNRQAAAQARAAAEANAKFYAFFEQGSHFAGVVELDGTLIEANRFSLSLCGYGRNDVIGKKFWKCGWWNRRKSVMNVVRQGCFDAAAGHLFRREIACFTADGTERIADLAIVPVTDAAGLVLYVAVTGIDITDQKRAEQALRASEERFRLLAELNPDGILVTVSNRLMYANPSAARMLGARKAEDILGTHLLTFIAAEFHDLVGQRQDLVLQQNQTVPLTDIVLRRLDGSTITAQCTAGRITWHGQIAIQLLVRDVTELRHSQNRLHIMSERLRLAIEGVGEGIWDWNIPEQTFSFFGGLKAIFGSVDEQQLPGNVASWQSRIHPEDLPTVRDAMQASQEGRVPTYKCQYRIRANNGIWRWVQAHGIVVERDDDDKPLVMTGTLSDITDRKESDELIWRHANLDALTELPNRRLFRERLELELRNAKRSSHHLALLFIDLDGFKQVNDLHGHDAGDLLLIEVGRRLQSCVRETDTVARLGGDEFTVILTNLGDVDHIEFVCQKILARLAEAFQIKKDLCYVSASIGASLYPLDAITSEDLLRKADQAMYAAKYAGKNQFSYFTKEMDEKAHLRLQLTNELRHAINQGQLKVLYQPVIDLTTGAFMKAEALLRWHHPRLGTIEPAEFIPLAEESRLINQIGDWVFKQAASCCKLCSEQLRAPFQISVNKSPAQFVTQATDQGWIEYLAEQNLPGNSISIEITEGLLLKDSSHIKEMLLAYRDAGIQIALDDFGTGYASMSYLQKFQIDYVKIDRSFVQDITCNPSSRTIVESIIMLAHKLGQKVIAEGVETQEQLDCLVAAGCDYGQGFLFCHAISEAELLDRALRSADAKAQMN